MVGRLLSLGPIEIEKFTLTKEALELVDKEFAQVNICFFFSQNQNFRCLFHQLRSMKKSKKLKLVLNNLTNN